MTREKQHLLVGIVLTTIGIVGLLWLADTASSAGTTYSYNGLYGVRTGTFHVSLDRETVRNGHVDIWVGADVGGMRWVQAGVAHDRGAPPYVYIESTDGKLVHVRDGRSATVSFTCDRYGCTATVGDVSVSEYLPARERVGYVGGESYEPDGYQNHYLGHVDGWRFSR